MRQKKFPLKLAAITLSLLLTGCAAKTEPDLLRLGVMYSTDIVPLVIIQAHSLEKKRNFQLDMQVFSSARERDAALQAGALDGVFTDYIGVCIYRNAGLDVRITGVTDGDYLLLAGPNTGISSVAESAGQGIAISENTLIEYTLDYILEERGCSPDFLKKEVVPKIPDRLALLGSGGVALGLLPDPFATLGLAEGATLLSSANAVGLYPAVSAFTGEALAEKADAISHFYSAYDEAVAYLNSAPPENFAQAVIAGAGYPPELAGHFKLPVFRSSQLPEPEALERAIRWASTKGLCAPSLTPADLLWSR